MARGEDEDRAALHLKRLARVKHVQNTLTEQWSVLATMTPSEYAEIRPFLASSSGFQSAQYREVEFLLGNKDAAMVPVHEHDPAARAELAQLLEEPSLYDEFLRWLGRHGYAVPADRIDRDFTQPYQRSDAVVEVFRVIYADPDRHYAPYDMCEKLVDVEERFQLWRFRHMTTVKRIIGFAQGTGGSSGVGFLKKALDLTFFPELWDVRTHLAAPPRT